MKNKRKNGFQIRLIYLLNTNKIESAEKMIAGTARSMGIKVE